MMQFGQAATLEELLQGNNNFFKFSHFDAAVHGKYKMIASYDNPVN